MAATPVFAAVTKATLSLASIVPLWQQQGEHVNGGTDGRYANYFEVGHSAAEFLLEFGLYHPGDLEPRLHTRIIASPTSAKALLELLRESLERYQGAFGTIPDELAE
jgi:hypothetical protein